MPNETLNVIKSLHSTHWNFSDKPVSREAIEAIIAHSLCAANNNDHTDITVVVVDDPDILNEISGGESEGRAVPTLIYALDYNRVIRCAKTLGYDQYAPKNRLYHLLFGVHGICAAAQTAVIAAKSMGIDSLVTNFIHRNDPKKVIELLDMPEKYCFPIIQVALSYAEEGEEPKERKISTKPVIHYNKYRSPDDMDIQSLIRDMDATYPQYISEKYPHALNWFFSEWWIEHYDEEMYQSLMEVFARSELFREPSFMNGEKM